MLTLKPTMFVLFRRYRWDQPASSGVMYAPVIPPSTTNDVPVMNDDSSLARKSAALAISSGRPKRPIGMWTRRRLRRAGDAGGAGASGGAGGAGGEGGARRCFEART